MRRRDFVGGLIGAAAWQATVRAEERASIKRIGYLGLGTPAGSATRIAALRAGLNSLGYIEGKNIVFEFRLANTPEELQQYAFQLVALNVDVIFATSSTEVGAAKKETNTVPIVFATHADPVGTSHVATLAQPGGNITGISVLQSELTTKALELLKEVVPQATRFGAVSSPTVPSHEHTMRAAEAAAEKLGVALQQFPVHRVEDFQAAFVKMVQARIEAVFVATSSLTVRSHPELLAQLALKHRLPTMFGARDNVVASGLMSYSPNHLELTRRSAIYIDKIIKGAKASELAVEQASQYQLIINLKTANALGLTIPPSLLARADEVIE